MSESGALSKARMGVGSIIGAAISICTKNFLFFALTALASMVPLIVLQMLVPTMDFGSFRPEIKLEGFLLFLAASYLISGILIAIYMYAVVMHLRGESISYGRTIIKGIGRAGYALIAQLIISIGLAFGFALLLIPGLILSCYWYVAVPAATIERAGPFKAISRSNMLTKTYRWTMLGVLLILGITNIVVQQLIAFFVQSSASTPDELYRNFVIATSVLTVSILVLQSVAAAYAYAALTLEKDGIGIDELAKVFD